MGRRIKFMVVVAKSGEQGLAAQSLTRAGFEAYLPLTLSDNRRRVVPMFGEYLFARFFEQWTPALYAHGVHSVVRTTNRLPGLIDRSFVDALREREDRRGVIDLDPPFVRNQPLRVTKGMFAGSVGLFSHSVADRVHVMLSLLGKEHVVALKRSELETV